MRNFIQFSQLKLLIFEQNFNPDYMLTSFHLSINIYNSHTFEEQMHKISEIHEELLTTIEWTLYKYCCFWDQYHDLVTWEVIHNAKIMRLITYFESCYIIVLIKNPSNSFIMSDKLKLTSNRVSSHQMLYSSCGSCAGKYNI